MDHMEDKKASFADHDASFMCLGTTRKDAGSAEAFRKIDLHWATKFANLSKEAGIPHFQLLTAQGSNKNSWFLYPQTKGEVR
jgi:oxidoreductase